MDPDPRPERVSICTTAGLTAAATAAMGSALFGSTTGVGVLPVLLTDEAAARPAAGLLSSVTRANTNPASRRTRAATTPAATRGPRPPDEGTDGNGAGGGGGGG